MKWILLAVALAGAACSEEPSGSDASISDSTMEDGAIEDIDGGIGDSSIDAGEIGRFEEIAALAEGPRQETAVVALRGEVFVLGGYDESMQFGALVEAYDPGSNTWRRASDLPTPMHHANAAVAAGKIYVLGFLERGFGESGRTFSYDPIADEWIELGPMPAQRQRGASVTVAFDDKIYVIGGLRAFTAVADVDEYDPSSGAFRALPPLPRAMDHGVGGVVAGRLLVAGGRAGGITSHTDRLDVFDLAIGAWTEGAPMPTGRAGAAGAVLAGRLYVFGGEGNRMDPDTRLFAEVEAYDVALDQWFALTPMDPPRHGMGAAALSDRIIVPGGATIEGFGATSSAEAFFP